MADSLTSFSNAWGEQVFYVDSNQHVNLINFAYGANQDLSRNVGGTLAQPLLGGCTSGASMTSISSDDKGGEDVFYVGADQHVYEFHYEGGITWLNIDLTRADGGLPAGQNFCLPQ